LKVASDNDRVNDPVRSTGTRDYGLAPAVRARLLGASLALMGLAVGLAAVVVTLTGLPEAVLTGLVVLAVIGIVVLGLLLGRRPYVVRLDDLGYRIRFVRGVGRTGARWTDVLDLSTAVVSGTECVVLRLRDGGSSTVPVNVIEGDREEFVDELQRRLDAGHGYRRL
jgi:predicted DNA repair protein MutK